MMLRLVRTACLTLVTCSLGEQHLQGHPSSPSSLATDDSRIASLPRPSGNHQSLITMARGMFSPEEDFKAVTDFKHFSLLNLSETIATFFIWLTCYFLCALYYHQQVRFRPPIDEEEQSRHNGDYNDFQDFRTGLFGCDQSDITFWSCLCPGIRWADTNSKLGIHGFWSAFWLLTVLYCLSFIPIATPLCFLIVVCYMTVYRQEFRKAFSFDEQGGMTWATDCLTYCCCMCCAVAQEARHCREGIAVAHPAIAAKTPCTSRNPSPRPDPTPSEKA